MIKAKTTFKSGPYEGTVETERFLIPVNMKQQGVQPYEMLYGSLATCIHANVSNLTEKMRLQFSEITYDITGIKADKIPALLTNCNIDIEVFGVAKENEEKFFKAIHKAFEYCSIYNTIGAIAKMSSTITFK